MPHVYEATLPLLFGENIPIPQWLTMFRPILVQFAEGRRISHYDGSVNPLYPELSTASVDERCVPSQSVALSIIAVASVVMIVNVRWPGLWPNDPGRLLSLYQARLWCHPRGGAIRSPVLRLNIEPARCEADEYPDATQQPR